MINLDENKSMIIDITSDLHSNYPFLQGGGDLLIIAGDLTSSDREKEYDDFWRWASYQDYKKVIVIAGNHDNFLQKNPDYFKDSGDNFIYLCDSGYEFEGLKIWGSPWIKKFKGINPKCCAFTVDTDEELAEKWKLIPDDTNILITHSPPHGILDKIKPRIPPRIDAMLHVGSDSLLSRVADIKPILHCFGHTHEGYLMLDPRDDGYKDTIYVNASYVNENYEPVNPPIRVVL